MGVDLFFVLSGFLITGILVDIRGTARPLRTFYARRVLRIMPLYVVFLLFSLSVAGHIGTSSPDEVAQLHDTQLWYWSYMVNNLIALRDWSSITLPTGHLWSLALEEQFYLLWPFVVLAISTKSLRRTAIGCIVVAELIRLMFVITGASGQVNFVLLPTRMDLLAAGAFLACAYRDEELWARVLRSRQHIALIGLLLFLATVLCRHTIDSRDSFDQLVLFPAIVALAAVATATAVHGVKWLATSPMRFVGRISYGIYVWHLVVMRLVLLNVTVPQEHATANSWWLFYAEMVFGTFFGSIVLAYASWLVIEQPFLQLKSFVAYSDARNHTIL
ncbi:MAG: acyltransferase [Gemmatimonadota bacterium]|nr:acyltransferase [Gemmatimonadota bacterium]